MVVSADKLMVYLVFSVLQLLPASTLIAFMFQRWFLHKHTHFNLFYDWRFWCACMCRQRGLFRVLKAYTQHQPEEGYCQAQGPVAAVLLMNMPAEVATSNTVYLLQWTSSEHMSKTFLSSGQQQPTNNKSVPLLFLYFCFMESWSGLKDNLWAYLD